jgi:hypothetical protein
MRLERPQVPPPREKTFAELFPWRNMRRALMLALLILGIVIIKRSAAPMLSRASEMWGSPQPQPSVRQDQPRVIRLGPGLRPAAAPPGDGK